LYDVSSSFYEGRTCPLAQFGHDRDGKKGLPIIVYGVMTNGEGCPVAVEVYPGNTGDPTTVADQIEKLREQFGLSRVVMVGDRGMLTQPQIDKLKLHPGFGWITALKSTAIRELVEQGALQLSLLDQKNLAEITSPDYPGERLMVCHNPFLEEERKRKRQALLEATEKSLQKISKEVARRKKKLLEAKEIGVKVGKVLGRYKMGKHFECKIGESSFAWNRLVPSIEQEEKLDGIYVVRTSEPAERLSAEETVRSYKSLAEVERAFRCLKGVDLFVRPIRHRTEDRVPAHIFLCVLAYYVEWHLRRAWAPLLFEDEERQEERQRRDPILPAQPSASAPLSPPPFDACASCAVQRPRVAAGGAPASRSDSARATLGLCTAQEAHASNGGGDSGAKFQELARGAGQKGQSDLRAQVREGRREVKSDLLAGTGAP